MLYKIQMRCSCHVIQFIFMDKFVISLILLVQWFTWGHYAMDQIIDNFEEVAAP